MDLKFRPFAKTDWLYFGGAEPFEMTVPVSIDVCGATATYSVVIRTEPLIADGQDLAGTPFTICCDRHAAELHFMERVDPETREHRCYRLNHPVELLTAREAEILMSRTPLPWAGGAAWERHI